MKKTFFITVTIYSLLFGICHAQWQQDVRLTNNFATSQDPSVAVSGSVVHVVWSDGRIVNFSYEIYYKRSTDTGVSWGADIRLTNNSANSIFPTVSVSSQIVHVVWSDNRDANYEIYYKRSTDAGISWGADIRLTDIVSGLSFNPSVLVSDTVVHVVWQDDRDGNWEIYYKRNPTGNPVGIININTEVPKEFKLEQNYPNPFNPVTNIKYQIVNNSFVSLKVYDITGKEVITLINQDLKSGTYEVDWDGSNFSSGVYFYKLLADNYSETRKMISIK